MSDVLAPNPSNYTKGGAQILIKRTGASGYVDIGNVTDFAQQTNSQILEHKTARSGVLIVDRREKIEAGFSFKIGQDEFNAANLALVCNAADPSAFTQSLGSGTVTITNPVLGAKYALSAFHITNLVAKRAGSITLTAGTDYSAEADVGLFRPLPGAAVLTSDTLTLTFDKPAISGNAVSPLSETGLIRGAIILNYRDSDGRIWVFTHTRGTIAYEGDVNYAGTEFSKASGVLTVEPDYTQTDVFGKWVMLPAP